MRPWLAFAEQKLAEIVTLTRAVNEGEDAVAAELAANRAAVESAAASPLRRNPEVRQRLAELPPDADRRALPYAERAERQRQRLNLPPLPTTTIGSFPQTGEIRSARKAADAGTISTEEYEAFLEGADRRRRRRARRRSGWTCWSTASRSATTWSSTSASSSTASPSPATAGCRATARATCGRRSSTATSPGRAR